MFFTLYLILSEAGGWDETTAWKCHQGKWKVDIVIDFFIVWGKLFLLLCVWTYTILVKNVDSSVDYLTFDLFLIRCETLHKLLYFFLFKYPYLWIEDKNRTYFIGLTLRQKIRACDGMCSKHLMYISNNSWNVIYKQTYKMKLFNLSSSLKAANVN